MELICTDQNGFRRVNNREADALRYTFGISVGSYLINIIKVGYDPGMLIEKAYGRTISKTKLLLQSNYNSVSLFGLGVFIHEAAHIWQRNTGLHQEGVPGKDYNYNFTQLRSLDLKIEEHAEAVQDWFHVTYGLEHGLIGSGANRLDFSEIRQRILDVMGIDSDYQSDVKLGKDDLLQLVEVHYTPLIQEIRNPCHIPVLRAAHCR